MRAAGYPSGQGGAPRVTVAVCTIPGREALLERALASIAAQTRRPDVVLIEPDPLRGGACDARNRALAAVDTEYVAWLDDDDELLPQHLELLAAAAYTSRADVVYPWFICDPPSADNLRCRDDERRWVSPLGVEFGEHQRAQLLLNNFLPITTLMRVEAVRAVGGFVALEPDGSQEDAGVYRALAAAGASFLHVPERTWIWHRGPQSTAGRALRRPPRR